MSRVSTLEVRNVLANWGAFFFTAVASFFLAPFIVHELGNTAYGAWVLLLSLVGYLGLLDLGVRGAVMRFIARLHAMGDHAEAQRFASAALSVFGLSSAIAIVAGIGLAVELDRFFELPASLLSQARIATVLSAVTMALALMNGIYGGIITAMQRFDLLNAAEIVIEMVRIASVVLVLRAGEGLVALASIQLACGALRLAFAFMLSRRLYPELRVVHGEWSRSHIRQIIGYSAASTAIHSAAVVILQLNAIIIGTFIAVSMVTYYSIAASLTQYGKALADGVAYTVPPRVSAQEGRGDMQGARLTALFGGKLASLVHLPIVVTFLLRGDTFIGLWMGPEYATPSGHVLWILSLAFWFIAGRQIMVTTLMGLNKHRVLVPAAWLEAILNGTLSVIFARKFGIQGVAWGMVLPSLLITTAVYPVLFSRAIGVRPSSVWNELWLRPSLAMIPFASATFAVDRLYPSSSLLVFFAQVAAVVGLAAAGGWWIAVTKQERVAIAARIPQRLRGLATLNRKSTPPSAGSLMTTDGALSPTSQETAVALLAFPDRRPLPPGRTPFARAFHKLELGGRYRRNARSEAYMRDLAAEVLGRHVELLDAEAGLLHEPRAGASAERLTAASTIVLLWPDATGYGWRPIERRVLALRRRGARVFVLSGRRRHFELTPMTLTSFRARRLLERLWLGEMVLAAVLLLAAPVLVAWDFARGRR
jgi:O-antigen/teichoic acid export membrane protein